MTCELCRRAQDDGFREAECKGIETISECPIEQVPKLLPANERFWSLFERISYGLISPDKFDFSAIDYVFNLYDIPAGQRPILHDKCLVVISVIQEIREAHSGRGQSA